MSCVAPPKRAFADTNNVNREGATARSSAAKKNGRRRHEPHAEISEIQRIKVNTL